MAQHMQYPDKPRVMLVTGASSGIGEATARRLALEPGSSLVLVARREERLQALAQELRAVHANGGGGGGGSIAGVSAGARITGDGDGRVSYVAADLLDEDAPARIREHVLERYGRLDLLVNNAGASWRARFADGGYDNVQRTMAINFDAVVRLTEALLPLLRACAPSAIVNVSSTAGRVARAGAGAYSASKFALAGWSDALWAEERAHGVHVGLVLPGFISTEGFPQRELTDKPWTKWIVSTPEHGAEAIVDAGLRGRAERYVPRPYGLAAALRVIAPALVRPALGGPSAAVMTTTTGADLAASGERRNGTGPSADTAARS